MIENTSESAKNPEGALAFLAASMGPGGSAQAIAEQERAGQTQLVNSDRLPADLNGNTAADFAALGIVLGDPDPRDPLFLPATLPEGWKRQGSDHDMWSYVVDQLGRRRVSVFYKAAFYDRNAHMNVESVAAYVDHCVYSGTDVITDDTWATPAAIVAAARQGAERYGRWEQQADEHGEDGSEDAAKRQAYEALIARFEGQAKV